MIPENVPSSHRTNSPKVFQVKNKKGTRGKMALSFSSFLSDVWGGHLVKIVPRSVKSVISEYAPQFCGYAQHDAQEVHREAEARAFSPIRDWLCSQEPSFLRICFLLFTKT